MRSKRRLDVLLCDNGYPHAAQNSQHNVYFDSSISHLVQEKLGEVSTQIRVGREQRREHSEAVGHLRDALHELRQILAHLMTCHSGSRYD